MNRNIVINTYNQAPQVFNVLTKFDLERIEQHCRRVGWGIQVGREKPDTTRVA